MAFGNNGCPSSFGGSHSQAFMTAPVYLLSDVQRSSRPLATTRMGNPLLRWSHGEDVAGALGVTALTVRRDWDEACTLRFAALK